MALKVTATITRVGFFDKALAKLSAQGKEHVREAVKVTAESVAASARALAPVSGPEDRKAHFRPGPGELRATIRAEMSNDPLAPVAYVKAGMGTFKRRSRAKNPGKTRRGATTGSEALGNYALGIEYGIPHRGINAQPYLRPALDKNRAAHIARVKAAVDRATFEADR